ncbi:MAG TPA: helix-turn-helix transcriptional regulator [Ideonella sp.]|uniref:AraC family transcriptional regulator n=1 Tax=Ideonella sp. TaxID=1929293 RepID=UPI002E31689D|nr:helix-turn-helix transcriptional regulator [Ideonella sp.]HEX5687574.1 helix-turn-helix transcriptional regulator [Ideonella sp.]
MPKRSQPVAARSRTSVPPLDPMRYAPTATRPLRGKARHMAHHMDIQPHWHSWAQLVFSMSGAVRVSAQGDGSDSSYLVPPSRAVWIPPGVVHAVTAVEQADLRTVYLHEGAVQQLAASSDWSECRVLDVTPLLRELVIQLATAPDGEAVDEPDRTREQGINTLILDELRRARSVQLGLPLPREGRLRRVCDAMLDEPLRHADIEGWAAEAATSARTLSRWFSEELGTSYGQWRQQLLLAKALAMAARKLPMNLIAAELGYASPSAFSAMVTRAVGMPPSRFFAEA